MLTQPYVYKLTHVPSNRWYVGARYAKGCHPQDEYMSSSKIVKSLFQSDPLNWKKEIVMTGTVDKVCELETFILQETDAKNDEQSFNQHNNDNVLFRGGWNKGQKMDKEWIARVWDDERREATRQRRLGLSSPSKGTKWSDESKKKRSIAGIGKCLGIKRSEETKSRIGIASKGRPQKAWKDPIRKAELVAKMLETRRQNKSL
jgi:hypothetical protein